MQQHITSDYDVIDLVIPQYVLFIFHTLSGREKRQNSELIDVTRITGNGIRKNWAASETKFPLNTAG
jgi:hypothetical protein